MGGGLLVILLFFEGWDENAANGNALDGLVGVNPMGGIRDEALVDRKILMAFLEELNTDTVLLLIVNVFVKPAVLGCSYESALCISGVAIIDWNDVSIDPIRSMLILFRLNRHKVRLVI